MAVVVRNVLPIESMNQAEIDAAVAERLRTGESLYQVDERVLDELAPDLIITQDLCQVCAPSGNELSQALQALMKQPHVLWMTPKSIAGIEENLRSLGHAAGIQSRAESLIRSGQERLRAIEAQTRSLPRPR